MTAQVHRKQHFYLKEECEGSTSSIAFFIETLLSYIGYYTTIRQTISDRRCHYYVKHFVLTIFIYTGIDILEM